jgi:methyl-accepting chemotaxis protein
MNRWKIGTRLGAGFAAVLVLLIAITGIGWWQLDQAAGAMRSMMREPLAKERLVADWYRAIHTSVRRTTAVVKSADPALAAFFAPENAEASKRSNELQKSIEALLSTEAEKREFAALVEVRKRYVAARDQIVAAKAADPDQAARLFEQSFLPACRPT